MQEKIQFKSDPIDKHLADEVACPKIHRLRFPNFTLFYFLFVVRALFFEIQRA